MEATFDIYRGGRWRAAATLTPVDHTDGIARVCRWNDDIEQVGNPDWAGVVGLFPDCKERLRTGLRGFGRQLQQLPETMRSCGVDDDIIERCDRYSARHARRLLDL